MMQNLLILIFIGQFKPMADRKSNYQEIFNEFMICLCTIILLAFTQFVDNPFTKFAAGWISVLLFLVLIVVNVFVIVLTNCLGLKKYRIRYYNLLKMKKDKLT